MTESVGYTIVGKKSTNLTRTFDWDILLDKSSKGYKN